MAEPESLKQVSVTMAVHRFVCCFAVMVVLLCKDCHSQQPECGRAVGNNRIIGGQDAPPGSWPWQAFFIISGFFQCGGSLISDQWVLTAAHCITSQEVSDSQVVLGLQSRSGPLTNARTFTLDKVICHPQYSSITNKNDICLLRLSVPVNFTNYIRPICLASENSTFNKGISSWVTGFGISSNLTFPDTLQEVNVPVVGNNECQCYNNDLGLTKVTENMICTGPEAGGKSPCFGDGGGPLMINKDSVWIQSGIVSFSVGCAQPLRPHVYTRVSKYQKWISDTITDKKPGFVTFTSPGTDSDLNFNCSTFVRPTPVPTTVPTTVPINVGITAPTTVPINVSKTVPTTAVKCNSLFCSGGNLILLTHFTSLYVLVALLHMFVGNGGI